MVSAAVNAHNSEQVTANEQPAQALVYADPCHFQESLRVSSPYRVCVRLGLPQYVTGLRDVLQSPIYATGVGLLLYGYQQQFQSQTAIDFIPKDNKSLWNRMKGWFQGNF